MLMYRFTGGPHPKKQLGWSTLKINRSCVAEDLDLQQVSPQSVNIYGSYSWLRGAGTYVIQTDRLMNVLLKGVAIDPTCINLGRLEHT